MKKVTVFVLVLLGLGALFAWQSLYTVAENEQVIVTQFGSIMGAPITAPGLHFKAPFIQDVHRLDKRWLEWDGAPNQMPTRDKKYIWAESYARWRIIDPVLFFKRLRDEMSAHSRLDDIIDGEIRTVVASHDLIEVVRTTSRAFDKGDESEDTSTGQDVSAQLGREKLTRIVLEKASPILKEYGVELEDVRIRRLNYVESVQEKVFERMISERKRIAERYRSEGQGKSAEVRGRIERELKTIESGAYRTAAEIRGKADAEAAGIYAGAYNSDPDLYQFTKTMAAYKKSVDANTWIVLSTDSELLKFLKAEK